MKTFFSTILFIAVCFSSPSFGVVGTPNEIFRPLSKRHVEFLIKKGLKSVSKMDLEKLNSELDEVEWRLSDVFFMGSGNLRSTSIYIVEMKTVVVNKPALQNMVGTSVSMFGWALHEALGALGYDDEYYELSSAIGMLANDPELGNGESLEYVEKVLKNTKRTDKNRRYTSSGGATVVGGGGDAEIIELKQRLINQYRLWPHNKKGFEKILRLKIDYDDTDPDNYGLDFSIKGEKMVIKSGGRYSPDKMYESDYLDQILNELMK